LRSQASASFLFGQIRCIHGSLCKYLRACLGERQARCLCHRTCDEPNSTDCHIEHIDADLSLGLVRECLARDQMRGNRNTTQNQFLQVFQNDFDTQSCS
jgi:hypothetical protein